MSIEDTKVHNICNCLSILTDDIKIADSKDPTRAHRNIKEAFAAELKRNVHNTFLKIQTYPNIEVFVVEYIQPCIDEKCTTCDYLKYLQLCLVLLRLLKIALLKDLQSRVNYNEASKPPVPQGVLSISEKKTLQKCLQFAVALGILPNLLRGIGIPLTRRLKHAIILEHFTSESTLYQKHIQIAVCLDTLIGCLECEAMQSTIVTYHGTDIMAALLQLCHAPIKKIENLEAPPEEPEATGKLIFKSLLLSLMENGVVTDAQIVNMMLAHRKYFAPHMEVFLKIMCPSLLMWELLLFQGIPLQSEGEPIFKTSVWLKKICNQMLTDLILQNFGIARLVQVIMDKAFDSDIQGGKFEASKIDAVARLVTYNPIRHITVPEYIERLSKQVFQCLHLEGSPMDGVLKYVGACIIQQFCARDMKSSEEHFLVKLLRPLWGCIRQAESNQTSVIVKELDLTICIEDLHQVFVVADTPLSRKFTKLILPYSHCLCNMYFFLLKGKSHLKSKVKNLIHTILTNSSDEDALSVLHTVSFSNSKNGSVYITKVSFANGDEGGIVAVPKVEEDFSDEIVRYHAILDILSEIQNQNLNRSYILLVLKEFCTFHLESKDNIMDPENIKTGILFNALLQELSEWNVDIGEALMSNISEVIDILMTLLESICNCRTDATFYEKTLWVVLMILNSILESDDQLTPADWTALKHCLPSLQTLQMSDVDLDLKEIIFSIIIHIATHGAACKNGMEAMKDILTSLPDSIDMDNVPSEQCLLEIIERYERDSAFTLGYTMGAQSVMPKPQSIGSDTGTKPKKGASGKKSAPKHASKKGKDSKKREPSYEAAVKDVKSPSIPMRGHGLISLGTLLKEKDEATLQSKKDLLSIFQENLEDDDSYVYLSAIQGLALLADIDAELVLPIVLSMYQKGENPSMILKLGEVLLKICNSLGDMIYKYKDQLLHTCLIVSKRDDPHIRSSSLSNLGQVVMCLKFNIDGHWLQEILNCVLSFLKTDQNIEVRRCTVMVLHLLLKGVGKDMMKVLENEMKTIYSHLKAVYTLESDDVIRLHSQLALEEINSIMKELLCAKIPLTKEIRILQ